MSVTIKYFGVLAEQTGVSDEQLDLKSVPDVQCLLKYCEDNYGLKSDGTIQIAINHELSVAQELNDGDEIALLPPFAGG